MYLCAYVYVSCALICVYVFMCICICVYLCMNLCVRVCAAGMSVVRHSQEQHVCMIVFISVCDTYACMYIYVYMHTRMYLFVCVCVDRW